MAGAIVCELIIGLTHGPHRRRAARHLGRQSSLMVASFVGVSAPQFVIGILLLYVFAVQLGWFPIGGYGTFAHLVLPALTLGIARRRLVCAHDALVDARRAAAGLYPHRPSRKGSARWKVLFATRCPTPSCPSSR